MRVVFAGCHGLAPWRVTLAATVAASVTIHGASPWHSAGFSGTPVAANVRDHGTSPWHSSRRLKLHGADLDLLVLLLEDDGVPLRRLLRRAGEAGDGDVDVRLA